MITKSINLMSLSWTCVFQVQRDYAIVLVKLSQRPVSS